MEYVVLSPLLDQSYVLASFVRKYASAAHIIGMYLPDEHELPAGANHAKIFDEIAKATSAALASRVDTIFIATGSESTDQLLRDADITLGEITLTRASGRVADKPWMLARAAAAGVPIPETWENASDVAAYPVFFKPRHDTSRRVRGLAHRAADLPDADAPPLIYQEYIEGSGTYGVAFLADQGALRAYVVHFERESTPATGGSAIVIERFQDARLVEYTRRLVQFLGYSGWGLAEFKYSSRKDDYVFMEINAKFWASCEFAFLNEPLFLKLLFGWDSVETPVQKLVFVNRLLGRGPWYTFRHLGELADPKSLRWYPGWLRGMASSFMPDFARRALKSFRSGRR